MPCDRIQRTDVDLGKVDPTLLAAALNALHLNAVHQGERIYFRNGSYQNGTLTLQGVNVDERTATIKQAYSGQVVRSTAKKYGWQVKEVAQNKFQVVKRTL